MTKRRITKETSNYNMKCHWKKCNLQALDIESEKDLNNSLASHRMFKSITSPTVGKESDSSKFANQSNSPALGNRSSLSSLGNESSSSSLFQDFMLVRSRNTDTSEFKNKPRSLEEFISAAFVDKESLKGQCRHTLFLRFNN